MSGQTSRVVVVSGLSGAGKSTALRALEDLGYFCIDNLPPTLAEEAVGACEAGGIERVALGVDVRVRAFLDESEAALARLSASGRRDVRVLFLDASDQTLLRRYSESRRPHPLSGGEVDGGNVGVLDGIHLERARLAPLRAKASIDLDTTRSSVHDLRRQILAHLGPGKTEQFRMATRVVSFGYKYGAPADADVVLDVRFLDNPFFVPALQPLPGTDAAVRDFVRALPETSQFLDRAEELLAYCLPRYEREGKSYLTIAIGCTGGRHRSVAIAQLLADRLRRRVDLPIHVSHRDVSQQGNVGGAEERRGGTDAEDRDVGERPGSGRIGPGGGAT